MDRLYLISFILLCLGIIFDGLLLVFFIASIVSLILLSFKKRDFMIIFLLGSIIGFAFERLGLSTGIPFGHYVYNFPPYVFGVPIFVVFGWGIFSFLSYLAIFNFPEKEKIIIFSFLMVIIDLSVDPIMVSAGYWTWKTSILDYFGIPITNFVGWFIVSLVIIIIYSLIRGSKEKSEDNIFSYLFPLVYFLFPLNFFIHAKPQLEEPLFIAMITSLIVTSIIIANWRIKYKIIKKS
ncbi:carotenoid biosynthesis protein [Acidianus manzaensis]|uniref:Carotenoid biosynthesis protein n=1 Tax=Acidianus manzaensis TaxID=282676 RepID=A0A1W6K341_9CREN|nr:carotenoid biosynthesis protein [Acidianus manzaensis]ARM76910.1 hypothetical protein B6F84_13375 [Acidianus manzaensis]